MKQHSFAAWVKSMLVDHQFDEDISLEELKRHFRERGMDPDAMVEKALRKLCGPSTPSVVNEQRVTSFTPLRDRPSANPRPHFPDRADGYMRLAASDGEDNAATPESGDSQIQKIQEFAAIDTEKGRIAFLDDGASVYVRLPESIVAHNLILGDQKYSLSAAAEDAGLFFVEGLMPVTAQRLVLLYDHNPNEVRVGWE